MLLVVTTNVEARLKYYRYSHNIPMVEMSLNMMVAMGVLEQIPRELVNDGNPYNRLATTRYSPYSRGPYGSLINSPYYTNRLYDIYGGGLYSPYRGRYNRYYGGYDGYGPRYGGWGNLWDSPWGGGLRSRPCCGRWGGLWGDQWGDQLDSPWNYGSYGYRPYRSWNYPYGSWGGNQWRSPWGGYGNNPWLNPFSSLYGGMGGWPVMPGYSSMPVAPGSMYGDNRAGINPHRPGRPVLIKYRKADGSIGNRPARYRQASTAGYRKGGYRTNNRSGYRNADQGLEGIWVGENREMLGIRGNDFLWHDGRSQYLNGKLTTSPTMMRVKVNGDDGIVHYRYRLDGDKLVTINRDGKVRIFSRKPFLQSSHTIAWPRVSYSSYKPNSASSNTSYSKSNYGSGAITPSATLPHDGSGSGASVHAYPRKHHEPAVPPKPVTAYGARYSNPLIPSAIENVDKAAPPAVNEIEKSDTRKMPAAAAVSSTDISYEQEPPVPHPGEIKVNTVPVNPDFTNGDDRWKPLTPFTGMNNFKPQPLASASYDPNDYLYSYMKDADSPAISMPSKPVEKSNSNIWISSSANSGNGQSSVSSRKKEKTDNFNIWKMNNSYANRQRYTGGTQRSPSAQNTARSSSNNSANDEVRKFVWSGTRSWD